MPPSSAQVSDAGPRSARAHLTKITARCDRGHSRSVRQPVALQGVVRVSLRFKLAHVLVLMGLLAGPAAALSSCWLSYGSDAAHACAPGCPMMKHSTATPLSTAQAQKLGATCCRVSPGKPVPVSQISVPTSHFQIAPPAALSVAFSESVQMEAQSGDTASPPCVAHAQSVLCTFLI